MMIYERSKLLYRRLHLIVNSSRDFKDFLTLNSVFRADETEWLENLSIFPGLIYEHYEHYEADTEADKVAPHHCYVCGSFCTFSIFMVFFCNGLRRPF